MILQENDWSGAPPRAAAMQLTTGAIGAGLAMTFFCPAVGAAGIGIALDGARVSPQWRWAYGLIGLVCAVAIAASFILPHEPPSWAMIGFGAFGLLAGIATMLAGLSSGLIAGRASSAGFSVLFGSGLLMLAQPAVWVCVAGAGGIGAVLLRERILNRRRGR